MLRTLAGWPATWSMGMDLTHLSAAQLDDLGISLIEELNKRQHEMKVLSRLTDVAIVHLGARILDDIGRRYNEASQEDKSRWTNLYISFIRQAMPDLIQARSNNVQFLILAKQMLN
jgi:hypothetical protein